MQLVLVAIVVATCLAQLFSADRSTRAQQSVCEMLLDMHRHDAELHDAEGRRQLDLAREELASRERMAMVGMRSPIVPHTFEEVESMYPSARFDPDPTDLDDLPDIPTPPQYDEHVAGGFTLPAEREMTAGIAPGQSIIPGLDDE